MFKLHFYKYNEYNVIRMLKMVKLHFFSHVVDFHVFTVPYDSIL
jgi:hypothetical protein